MNARELAITGTTAKLVNQVAETSVDLRIPAREEPPELAHSEFTTSLKLRVIRGER